MPALEVMPYNTLVKKSHLHFLQAYREYYAFNSIKARSPEKDLSKDYIFLNFVLLMDCW